MPIHGCVPFRRTLAILLTVGSCGAVAATDSKAGRYYEDALTRFEKNDLAGAIIQLKNALKQDSALLPVHLLLGKALLANGEVAAAEVAFNEAIRLGVNRAEVVIPLATAVVAQGKHTRVLEQPVFLPAGLPPALRAQLLLIRAAASADIGDAKSALRAIEEARAIDPRSPYSWVAEAPVRVRARQFPEALLAIDKAIEIAPENAEAWNQKASVLHVNGDLAAALSLYDKALQLSPQHVEARVARAGILIDTGRHRDAAADIAELQKRSPREPRAAYLRALIAEREGRPEAAKSALREVTALIDPVPVDFIRYRPQIVMLNGLAHFGLGETEKAKPYLELMLRAYGPLAPAKLLGQIYLSAGDATRTINVLEDYLRYWPGDAQAMIILAAAHLMQGRQTKAAAIMQDALAAKDTPAMRTALGLSLVQVGRAGDALRHLENAFMKDPGQVQAGFALAGLYIRNNQALKAVAVAETLRKQQPNSAAVFNQLGIAKGAAGDPVGARAAFEQALRIDPGLASASFNLVKIDIDGKAFDTAAQRLGTLLKANSRDVDALFAMAVLSERRGQKVEAQRWLEKARDHEGPKSHSAGLALVDFHLRHRQATAALDAVKDVVAKAPEDYLVLLSYARVQMAVGDLAAARTALTAASRVAEFDTVKLVEVALQQNAARDAAGASYSLEKALSSQPRFLPARVLMAETDLRLGEAAKAEHRARSIVVDYPKLAIGHSLLADISLARGQLSVAAEGYRKAHQLEPTSESLLRLFGTQLQIDGGKAAFPVAEQWLKSNPTDRRVATALADAYSLLGKFPAARKAYEDLLRQFPDDAELLNNLANVHLRLDNAAAAIPVAEKSIAIDSANPAAIDTLGWALFKAGQVERSLQVLRDARLRDPARPEIRYHLAEVLARTGRRDEALSELDAALRSERPFDEVSQARGLERQLRK